MRALSVSVPAHQPDALTYMENIGRGDCLILFMLDLIPLRLLNRRSVLLCSPSSPILP